MEVKQLKIDGVVVSAEEFVGKMRERGSHDLHFYKSHPEVGPLLRPEEKLSDGQKWMLPG